MWIWPLVWEMCKIWKLSHDEQKPLQHLAWLKMFFGIMRDKADAM